VGQSVPKIKSHWKFDYERILTTLQNP